MSNLQPLPDLTAEQWARVGVPVREAVEPGKTYSLNFEYKAATEQEFQLGLSSLMPGSKQEGQIVGSTKLLATNDWKTFWSTPFTVTAEQIRGFPNLRLLTADVAGIEIRNVRVLKQASE